MAPSFSSLAQLDHAQSSTDPASSFEHDFLDHLYKNKLRLPDFAQCTPATDIFVQPDFYYSRGAGPGICVFIDGARHDEPARRQEDIRSREALEDRGYRLVRIGPDRPLPDQIGEHQEIFSPASP
jgi:very-short-patch-repair endonuclease